jgi:hypothetical protein
VLARRLSKSLKNNYADAGKSQNTLFIMKTELIVEAGVAKSASFEAIRDQVAAALENQVRVENQDPDCYCWIQNMYSDRVVYSMDGSFYQRTYSISGDAVTFGDATEVEQTWTPIGESHRELVAESHQFSEAYDTKTGSLTVTVIKPGFNKAKSRFYPAEMLKRDSHIFEGAKMFADHQTDSEQKSRPEGSVNNWVANIKKVWSESDGTVKAQAVVIDPVFKTKLETLNENKMLSEMGISIRAIGEGYKAKVEGTETQYVESLIAARSVDFVTFAGAGGQVDAMESANNENDVDLMSEADLRKRRPDLISVIESTNKELKTNMKTLEQQLQEATTALAAEKTRADAAEAKIQESEKAARKATTASEIKKMISESKLPEPAQKKLEKQFAEAEKIDGVKEAIDAEVEYLKAVAPEAKVTNNGNKDNVQESDTAKPKPNSVESFKRLGFSEAEAKIAAGVK